MTIVTTVRDLETWASGAFDVDTDMSERIARYLWTEAHDDPEGPRSGEDWDEWLSNAEVPHLLL